MNFIEGLLVVLLLSVNAWGLTNGLMVVGFLFKSRSISNVVQAVYDSTIAMCLTVAFLSILLVQAVLWPTLTSDERPMTARIIGSIAFIGASSTISYGLHRIRSIFMGPRGEWGA